MASDDTWNAVEEVERALAAVHGAGCLLLPPDRRDLMYVLTKDYYASVLAVREESSALRGHELEAYCSPRIDQCRDTVVSWLTGGINKLPVLRRDQVERLFEFLRDRWNVKEHRLRANAYDIQECFDLTVLGDLLNLPSTDLRRLPPSVELVLATNARGLALHWEVPSRSFLLDAALQAQLARRSHIRLTRWATTTKAAAARRGLIVWADLEEQPPGEVDRLNAFVRQALVTSVTAIEAALSDYGHTVTTAVARRDELVNIKKATTGGVSSRLRLCSQVWPLAFGREPEPAPDTLRDMLALVQVRNRLVHHDGRPSAFHAMQLNLSWLSQEYHFTERIDRYLTLAEYGVAQTSVGHEYALCRFAVDTAMESIDSLHNLVYPGRRALWLRIPRAEDGRLDMDALAQSDPALSVEDW